MSAGKINKTQIALIGYGYWGKKVFQTLTTIFPISDIFVVDPFCINAPETVQLKSLQEILDDKMIDSVFIATPEETHFDLAKTCLEFGKNTFVEKPLCLKASEAKKLILIAQKKKVKLFVDYTFLFDPAVKKIAELIHKNTIGELLHIESIRHSINIHKPNVTVYDDLATHDLYLARLFFKKDPVQIKTLGQKIGSTQTNQTTCLFSFGKQTMIAHYSWIEPVAVRKMTFVGTKATIVWDRYDQDLSIYINQQLSEKVSFDQNTSPLRDSVLHFLNDKVNTNDYLVDVTNLEKLDKTNPE